MHGNGFGLRVVSRKVNTVTADIHERPACTITAKTDVSLRIIDLKTEAGADGLNFANRPLGDVPGNGVMQGMAAIHEGFDKHLAGHLLPPKERSREYSGVWLDGVEQGTGSLTLEGVLPGAQLFDHE